MKPYAFGIDIGGTTVKIGFFETTGTLLKKWEIPTRTDDGGSQILTDIAEAVKAELAEREIGAEDIEGIGMGIPGPVLGEKVVNKCVNLGWGVFNVAEEMTALTGIENVKAGNEANVAVSTTSDSASVGEMNASEPPSMSRRDAFSMSCW